MSIISNNKGIALITSLMFTVLSMILVYTLLYFVTLGTQTSSANKRYKTALESSYGGLDLSINELMPRLNKALAMGNYSSELLNIQTDFNAGTSIGLNIVTPGCLQQKLSTPRNLWSGACSSSLDAKSSPDMTFQLKSAVTGFVTQPNYTVYTKIVDNPTKGNTDPMDSSGKRSGENVNNSGTIEGTGITIPTTYRIEIAAEKSGATIGEQSRLSVLYAY